MIRVFIGYDGKESSAYHVLAHSIMRRASQPVSICPIRLSTLPMYNRDPDEFASTQFTFARFLVPYLCRYQGWAIFLDSDMLCLGDIAELWEMRDKRYGVMVAKHDYIPRSDIKMLGQKQTKYQMKNWSSAMLMHCPQAKALTPEYVNTASGMDLHQFHWLDGQIGEIPLQWNWLVGEYVRANNPKMLHWTLGGPWWSQYRETDYADLWMEELGSLLHETEEARIATSRLFQTAALGEIREAQKRAQA